MFTHQIDNHLSLHLTHPRYADAIFTVVDRNRTHLRAWLPWVDGTKTADDTRAWANGVRTKFADGKQLPLTIFWEGDPVGSIGLIVNTEHSIGEIGYWLDQAHEGRGIMTRACEYVIGQAFDEWQLNRLEIWCGIENTRSRAIPERFNFTLEGTFRQAYWVNNTPMDVVCYAMLRDEYQ